jgi:hypothetical protein
MALVETTVGLTRAEALRIYALAGLPPIGGGSGEEDEDDEDDEDDEQDDDKSGKSKARREQTARTLDAV